MIPWTTQRQVVVMPTEGETSDLLLHAQAGAYYPRHAWSRRFERAP